MKKELLLMVLILGMLLVGCGKGKEAEITSENIVAEVDKKNMNYDDFIVNELYGNEKYGKKINGLYCFYPKYKDVVFEAFANSEEQKSQVIKFCYETEEELKELKEYAIKFNETHERMKLDIENAIETPTSNRISFPNTYPNKK